MENLTFFGLLMIGFILVFVCSELSRIAKALEQHNESVRRRE